MIDMRKELVGSERSLGATYKENVKSCYVVEILICLVTSLIIKYGTTLLCSYPVSVFCSTLRKASSISRKATADRRFGAYASDYVALRIRASL